MPYPTEESADVQSVTAVPARIALIETLTLSVLGLGILLRLLMLDADPYYYEWVGYMTDEGRWIHYARNLALFEGIVRDTLYDLHFVLSPLFQAVTYLVFQVIGVTSASSRLFSALCGSGLLLLFWSRLRHIVSASALFAGVAILAVQVDFVALSRIAIPEMAMVFFEALAYFALLSRTTRPRQLWLPGTLLAVAVGMKGTAAISLGIFSLMVVLMPPVDGELAFGGRKRAALGWLLAGFITPVLVPIVIWFGSPLGEWPALHGSSSMLRPLSIVLQFVRFENLYGIFGFPFNNPLASALNYLALGMWLTWLAWIASQHDDLDPQSRRYLVTATIWTVGYLAVMLVLEYFPQRYRVQVVMPMAIAITFGIDLFQRVGLMAVARALERRSPWAPLRRFLLGFPTAVLLAPAVALVFATLGIDTEPLRVRMTCLIAVAAIIGVALNRIETSTRLIVFLILFPLTETAVSLVLSMNNWTHRPFWPDGTDAAWSIVLVASFAIAAASTFVAMKKEKSPGSSTTGLAVALYVVGYFALSTIRLVPGYLNPHYTIRDTSRELESLVAGRTVASTQSEGLFNDNALRYRIWRASPTDKPEIIVAVTYDPDDPERVDDTYALIKTYRAYVAPEYLEIHGLSGMPEIKIYKRR
jgi:4-amino-4-deoxy-L-arabinose transferase-like glycosyltransferase